MYSGTFGLASSPARATLTPVEADGLNLAVREGTYGDNYDIEAVLSGQGAGIAFRVKDKLNYWYVTQGYSSSVYAVIVFQVVDGQRHGVWYNWVVGDPGASPHIHIDVDGANLGVRARVLVDSVWTWETVISPASPDGDGYGLLSGVDSGLVGLTAGANGVTDAAECSLLRVGTLTSGDEFASDSAAAVAETFAASVDPSYDTAGNMTSDGIYQYTYDAWNRLVQVSRLGPTVDANEDPVDPETIATYHYDGLGRRYYKKVEHSGGRDREEYFYYDNRWRLLEVRVPDATSGDRAVRQLVWGTQYIDELVCMDVDTDSDGSCSDDHESGYGYERYRYFQDANWNVTAIWAEHAGHVVERYEYDPYGTCRIFAGWDSTAGCETGNVIGQSLVPGGNPIRYAGYYFDDERDAYDVRNRWLEPRLGRWGQRDPIGYFDGMLLYGYVRSNPIAHVDASGTKTTTKPSNPCQTEQACCTCILYAESGAKKDQGCYAAITCIMKTRQRLSGDGKWHGHVSGEETYCGQAQVPPRRIAGGMGNKRYTACCKCDGKLENVLEERSRQKASKACKDGCTDDPTDGAQYWNASKRGIVDTVGQINVTNGNCVIFQIPGCTQWFARCKRPPRADGR